MMEISLRIIKRGSPTYSEYVGLSNSGYYLPSKENTFKLIPNYKGSEKNQDWNLAGEPKSVKVSTDNRGFRSTIEMNEECKLNSFKTFLFLGDSYTFGVYLRDKDTYPSKFQYQSNNENKCFKVINAGYTNGHETDQIYSWLTQNIKEIKPDYIIYNVFAGNDILSINPKFWTKKNNKGLPINWQNNNIKVQRGFLRNKNSKPPLKFYYIPILRESKLLVNLENQFNILFTRLVRKKESGFNSAGFAHLYGIRNLTNINEKEEIFFKLIKGMDQLSQENKSKFFTVYMPANFEVYPQLFKKVAPTSTHIKDSMLPTNYGNYLCNIIQNDMNINCLNITNEMINSKGIKSQTLNKNFLYPSHGEIHMSKSGADFTARSVYNWLIKNTD